MKSIKGRMAIAAAAMAAATAHALQVNNPFPDRWVWVTTYNDNKRQIQSGCVDPRKARDFQRDGSSEGIKVRVEVMTAPGCKGDKTCDTDMSFGRFEVRNVFIHRNHQVQNRCYLATK